MDAKQRRALEWGPLPVRLAIGGGFIFHGLPKIMSATGHQQFAAGLASMGVPAADALAWVVGVSEVLGGLLLILGLFTRWATIPLIATMLVAIVLVALPNGFSAGNITGTGPNGPTFGPPGYEVNVLYLAGLLALLIGGPGALSLDQARYGRTIIIKRIPRPVGTPLPR
jgi:putative oxidoreductase